MAVPTAYQLPNPSPTATTASRYTVAAFGTPIGPWRRADRRVEMRIAPAARDRPAREGGLNRRDTVRPPRSIG